MGRGVETVEQPPEDGHEPPSLAMPRDDSTPGRDPKAPSNLALQAAYRAEGEDLRFAESGMIYATLAVADAINNLANTLRDKE